MKKPCILRILSDIVLHQAAMAEMMANPGIVDTGRWNYLHSEIQRNSADLKKLVAEFQVQVEPRALLP